MQTPANTQDRLIRLPEVLSYLPISKAAFYLNIKKGIYPAPLKISERTSAWRLSDILRIVTGETVQP